MPRERRIGEQPERQQRGTTRNQNMKVVRNDVIAGTSTAASVTAATSRLRLRSKRLIVFSASQA